MEVGIRIGRSVVVDDNVDTLHIDTTAENISGDQYSLLKILKLFIARDTRWRMSNRLETRKEPIRTAPPD